jgi:hypothetical protein
MVRNRAECRDAHRSGAPSPWSRWPNPKLVRRRCKTEMTLLLALPAAAALVAFWLVARFPRLLVSTFRAALLHFGFSLVLVWETPRLTTPMIASSGLIPVLVALSLVLSALVYAWISVGAVLRFVHEGAPNR